MDKFGISPDISVKSADEPDDKTCFYHRSTADADIYFVYNHSSHDYDDTVTLHTEHNDAELWNPKTIERNDADMSNDKKVKLRLKPYESTFIVVER